MKLVLSKIMDDASKLVEQYVAESQTGDMNDVAKDMNKSVFFLLCLDSWCDTATALQA